MKWLQFSRRLPGKPLIPALWSFGRVIVEPSFKLLYHLHVEGKEHIPENGGFIYASNHQSHLDPIALGVLCFDRPFISIGRASLFKFKPFGWLIRALGSVPIERGGGEIAAFQGATRELKAGRPVLIFPEGQRSNDGSLNKFYRGVLVLQKRSGVPILPLAIEGPFDIYPRKRKYPKLSGYIAVKAGPLMSVEELQQQGQDAGLEHLKRTIETMRLELRQHLREKTNGRYPAPGPGDQPYWSDNASDSEVRDVVQDSGGE